MERKRIAKLVWPRFSASFDAINRNAQMLGTIHGYEQQPIRKCTCRQEMYSVVHETLGNIAISYIEFGVWKGESLGEWIGINTDAGSRFYGFDSFEGLPEEWDRYFGKTTGKDVFERRRGNSHDKGRQSEVRQGLVSAHAKQLFA